MAGLMVFDPPCSPASAHHPHGEKRGYKFIPLPVLSHTDQQDRTLNECQKGPSSLRRMAYTVESKATAW